MIFGGHTDENEQYIEPTILDGITPQSKIMEEEILVHYYPSSSTMILMKAIDIIQSKSKPLSLYLFSEDENTTNCVLEELSFGGGAINDTLMHLANPNLPFGGVGASGIGEYHGKYSFDTFSHMKSYILNLLD